MFFCSLNSSSLRTPDSLSSCKDFSCSMYWPLSRALLEGDTPVLMALVAAQGCGGFCGDVLWEARAFTNAVAAPEIASVRLSFWACFFSTSNKENIRRMIHVVVVFVCHHSCPQSKLVVVILLTMHISQLKCSFLDLLFMITMSRIIQQLQTFTFAWFFITKRHHFSSQVGLCELNICSSVHADYCCALMEIPGLLKDIPATVK